MRKGERVIQYGLNIIFAFAVKDCRLTIKARLDGASFSAMLQTTWHATLFATRRNYFMPHSVHTFCKVHRATNSTTMGRVLDDACAFAAIII